MTNRARILAAAAAGLLVLATAGAPAAAKPRPYRPAGTSLSGCTTTVTDTAPNFGWFYRTTHEVCLYPVSPQSDCITVENVSTNGAPTVVDLPKTCRYSGLR